MRWGIAHPQRSGGQAQRSDFYEGKIMGRPLAPRQGRALSQGLVSLFVRVAHMTYREGVAGRNVPLRRVAKDAIAAADREERSFSLQTFLYCCNCHERGYFRPGRAGLSLYGMNLANCLRIVYFDEAIAMQTISFVSHWVS